MTERSVICVIALTILASGCISNQSEASMPDPLPIQVTENVSELDEVFVFKQGLYCGIPEGQSGSWDPEDYKERCSVLLQGDIRSQELMEAKSCCGNTDAYQEEDKPSSVVLNPGDSISFSNVDKGCLARNFNDFWSKNWTDSAVEVRFSATYHGDGGVTYHYEPNVDHQINYASHKITFSRTKLDNRCNK